MSKREDRELVELAQRGDAAAIGDLFSRYWRAARAAAFGVTGEFASAEDAAADAFRQAVAGLDSLRDPDRFGAWLRTIVVRKARLGIQRRDSPLEGFAGEIFDRNELPDNALERLELSALIQSAVRQLPERLREAIALFYFEGYDSDAASQFLDIPTGTLRRRLHDGRARLRKAIEQILQGSRQMHEERERQVQRLKTLLDKGEIYQAIRESLLLRPAPSQLIAMLPRPSGSDKESPSLTTELAQRLAQHPSRISDPNHPVGSIASAIRKALPEFQDWPLDFAEAASQFLTFSGERRDLLRSVLPPGFAEGRPGAFRRATRALVREKVDGAVQSIYEHLKESPDEGTFVAAKKEIRLSDVLDLTWMVAGPLELRSVQELLERLTSAVLPGATVRFSTYDEPRYRSALQMHIEAISARAACGGVLAPWPGRPPGVDSAHVRIFLESWPAESESGL